ncbi:restriction endonuclease subunit S [Citromicrobium bathyomarinum]
MSWPNVALGDLFEIARGGSPRPIEKFLTDDPNGLNWVSISDATRSGKVIKRTERKIRPEGLAKSRWVEPGDFLLSNSMSFGRPYIMGTTGCIHDGWLVLKPGKTAVDPDYLYHLLSSEPVFAQFAKRATGTTVKNLNCQIVSETKIPLPSLSEQKRIAAILDQADALRRIRHQAISRLNTFPSAFLSHSFEETVAAPLVNARRRLPTAPRGAQWVTLTDVARLATGHTPDRKKDIYWGGEIPWISLTDIRRLDGREAKKTSEYVTQDGIDNSSSVVLPAGTICLARTASVGFVTKMGREMATSQDFVNWVCGPEIDSNYLLYALISSRQELKLLAPGSTHKTIYFPTVKSFNILLPSLEVQRKCSDAIDQYLRRLENLEESLRELNILFASLQQRAFRGEL